MLIAGEARAGATEPAEVAAPPPRCSAMGCSTRVLAPVTRIATTEVLMMSGLMLLLPEQIDPMQVERNRAQFVRSWTEHPILLFHKNFFESDGDPWAFNVFAHGLFGSETYLAARGWGHSPFVSALFSLLSSFFWEFMIESWSQQPSTVDLVWTPLGGSILGELRYQAYMASKRGIRVKGLRIALMIVLDPLGEVERLMVGCER